MTARQIIESDYLGPERLLNTGVLNPPESQVPKTGYPPKVKSIFMRHPGIAGILRSGYDYDLKHSNYLYAIDQIFAVEQSLKLAKTGLSADCSDGELKEYCEVKSRNTEREFTAYAKRFNLEIAIQWLDESLANAGQQLPIKNKDRECKEKMLSAVARVCDPKWWRRRLRVQSARTLEQFLRQRAQVSRVNSPYVSVMGLARRGFQKQRNRQLLLAMEAVCEETGECINLAECADSSTSNPENRRTELMTRMSGYEAVSKAMGLQGMFLTLTCPGAYHPVMHKTGLMNPKYNGSSPRDAQDYLNRVWANIRSEWQREGIRVFGFRVAEPHHDGTPHWHMLLFIDPKMSSTAWEIFERQALAEDGNEWRAKEVRAECVFIDEKKGSATGYLAKYVSKNINGYGVENDHEAETPAEEGARRVDAWAGIWGIRQFQQIGSTSVTIWRELRRLDGAEINGYTDDQIEEIRKAADAGDWALFVELMGGALVARNGQTLRVWMEALEKENQYAEVVERIKGVILRGARLVFTVTRLKSWTMRKVETPMVGSGVCAPP